MTDKETTARATAAGAMMGVGSTMIGASLAIIAYGGGGVGSAWCLFLGFIMLAAGAVAGMIE